MPSRFLRDVLAELAEAIHPALCPLCGALEGADGLGCNLHRLELALTEPRCGRCAAELAPMMPAGGRCAACRNDPPPFARTLCLGAYGGGLREWILAFKHGGRADLALRLGTALAARLFELEPDQRPTLLVPVPLHPLRRLERGYDQAALLARATSQAANVPCRSVLRRTRFTRVQGASGSPSRTANVREAFAVRRWRGRGLEGVRIGLIDDVLTSGSTAAECARVLRRAGASEVVLAVLARA
jgi:ComF family protein